MSILKKKTSTGNLTFQKHHGGEDILKDQLG